MTQSPPEVMTIQETSEYLRVPVSSLYKLAQSGKIPCQKVGRHWRFKRRAIEDWLEPPLGGIDYESIGDNK